MFNTRGVAFYCSIAFATLPILAGNISQSNFAIGVAANTTIEEPWSKSMQKTYLGATNPVISENLAFSPSIEYIQLVVEDADFQAIDLNNLVSSYSKHEDLGLGNDGVTYNSIVNSFVTFNKTLPTISYPGSTKLEILDTDNQTLFTLIRASPV